VKPVEKSALHTVATGQGKSTGYFIESGQILSWAYLMMLMKANRLIVIARTLRSIAINPQVENTMDRFLLFTSPSSCKHSTTFHRHLYRTGSYQWSHCQ
jgi:hypothetical protein